MPAGWSRKIAQTHLEHVAASNDVSILWFAGDWRECEAFFNARCVKIQKPYTPRTYLAGLHELGHLLSPFAKRHWGTKDPEMYMAVEAAAWYWTLAHTHTLLARQCEREVWSLIEYGLMSHTAQLVRAPRLSYVVA
jgi:hypothetical protein